MVKFILSKLLSPLWQILASVVKFILARPALLWVIVGAALAGLAAAYLNQRQDLKQTKMQLSKKTMAYDSVVSVSHGMLADRNYAYHYADSLKHRNDTLRTQIKAMVGAMSPAQRTNLNRSLLSSLGLNK